MVINVGALRSGDHEAVQDGYSRQWSKVAIEAGAIVKVILETALLDDNQKAVGLHACQAGGRGFREDFDRLLPPAAPRRTTWR